MFPLLGGLLQGGLGLIGSQISANQSAENTQDTIAANAASQKESEAFNSGQTQQQEAFQTQMSNTAYQRASADMTAAGLNPASMFGSGSAASSPGGSAASISPMKYDYSGRTSAGAGAAQALQSVVPSAVALKTADATIDNLVQQNANMKTDQINKAVDTGLKTTQAGQSEASTRKTLAETENVKAALPIILDQGTSAKNRMDINPAVRSVSDQAGYFGSVGSKVIAPIANLVSSAKGIKSLAPQRSTTETTRDDGSSSFSERYAY